MLTREELIQAIKDTRMIWTYNSNGPDEESCPFCHKSVPDHLNITHDKNCILIRIKKEEQGES